MGRPYSVFQTDKTLEKEGIILDYGDFKIKIARAGGANVAFQKALASKIRPYKRQIDAGTIPDDVAEKLLLDVYAESVVLGWEGVTDEKGKPLPFSKENVVKLFSDLPDLFRDVQNQAAAISNFRAEVTEDTIKN
ncbi:MAG TPA: hypothetical protein PLK67_00460 [Bryobacteraceae bacterium]|nr:hypothetical protein [Bryobacteraceae bacterium]